MSKVVKKYAMSKKAPSDINQHGAHALLIAAIKYLLQNGIAKRAINDIVRNVTSTQTPKVSRLYSELVRVNEKMGALMAIWFSDPRFLNASGEPISLSTGRGSGSISSLIRASGSIVEPALALRLMRQSPSIRFDNDGRMTAIRRVFVLPDFEIPRAAFVVERYLNTLHRNICAQKGDAIRLLEQSAHVSGIDLQTIGPLLRDIKTRGTAFLDSVDGEMEVRRLPRAKSRSIGEVGVLVFAWTKPAKRLPKKSGLARTSSKGV